MFRASKSISIPNVDTAAVRLAIDVIHYIRRVNDLSFAEVLMAIEGCNILDCGMFRKGLLNRLWHHVSESGLCESDVLTAAPHMMHDGSDHMCQQYVDKVMRLCPTWKTFSKLFERVNMSERLAKLVVKKACDHFPLHLVFCAILDAMPAPVLSLDVALRVLGVYKTGVYHHPDELVMCLNRIASMFPSDPGTQNIVTMTDALQLYDSSPVSKITATTLTFSHTVRRSILMRINEPFKGQRTVRIKRDLKIRINAAAGSLMATLRTDRWDGNIRSPVSMRVMTFASQSESLYDIIHHKYDIDEAWEHGHFLIDDDEALVLIATMPQLQNCSKSSMKYVRLDFFFGHWVFKCL
jgi:hypothetical protein